MQLEIKIKLLFFSTFKHHQEHLSAVRLPRTTCCLWDLCQRTNRFASFYWPLFCNLFSVRAGFRKSYCPKRNPPFVFEVSLNIKVKPVPNFCINLTLVYLYMQSPTKSLLISRLSIWSCHTVPFLSTFNVLCNSFRHALSQTLLSLPCADSSLKPKLPTEETSFPRTQHLRFHISPRRLTILLFNTSASASEILFFYSLRTADSTSLAACMLSPILKRKRKKSQRFRVRTRGQGREGAC